MTSPSPSPPHSTALRRLKAAHDASRAARALKRGDRGKAAELYLLSSSGPSCSSTFDAASKARALSNASAALCAAGRFRAALEAAEEAIRLSSPPPAEEEQEEEEEEEGGDDDDASPSSSLALCLPPQLQPPLRRRSHPRLGWSKPHWRRGAALRGLGEHLAAALSFADAHWALESEAKMAGGKAAEAEAAEEEAKARLSECAAAVREGVSRGARRAADAASLLCDSVLGPAEDEGRLLPRSPLSAGGGGERESLRAAAAAVVAGRGGGGGEGSNSDDQNAATSAAYLSSLSGWLIFPPSLPQLLVERSGVFCAAGQRRAAVADARRALELSLARENQPFLENNFFFRVEVRSEKEKENEKERKKNSTRSEQQQLRPATSDAAALALARALMMISTRNPGDEEHGSMGCSSREAARALSEGIARIRRRAFASSSSSATAAASSRERAASALAAPLVELLRKIQESGELAPGEVGEILASSSSSPSSSRRRRLRLGLEFSSDSSSSPLDATGARSALLLRVSEVLRVPRTAVALERVSRSGGGKGGALSLSLLVSGAGAEEEKGEEGDCGSPSSSSLEARLRSALEGIDLCPESIRAAFFEEEKEEAKEEEEEKGSALVPLSSSSPPLDLSLLLTPPPPPTPPRLTDANGRPLPPVPRHAFALSRVHYSYKDVSSRSVDSWLDVPRLGLRWRQSAGGVTVVVASVAAAGLSAAEVEVEISPRRLIVVSSKRKKTRSGKGGESGVGEEEEEEATKALEERTVFLDLALERMVVPDESTWTLLTPGGQGEEGLLVTLAKANVELFASAAAASSAAAAPSPSLSWWPRLAEKVHFPPRESDLCREEEETAVAWDDYEKDYSDLPRFAVDRINAAEAALRLQDSGNGSGGGGGSGNVGIGSGNSGLDRALRRSLACADDSRRRHRATRLREMRRQVISRGEEAGKVKKEKDEE